uniref:Secreted protein n=1 Tax=Arundo donax TaxID=35708 RepID=A0A0A9H1H3_ARUDO
MHTAVMWLADVGMVLYIFPMYGCCSDQSDGDCSAAHSIDASQHWWHSLVACVLKSSKSKAVSSCAIHPTEVVIDSKLL